MELTNDQKVQILLVELQEQYNASHKIRERSIQFTLWISGMAIALGWILISQRTLVLSQRIALTLLIATLLVGTFYFVMGLRRGFNKKREALISNESVLGMHDPNIYRTGSPLLPTEYSVTKRKWGDHFHTLYIWLILVAISLLILTWTCPESANITSSKAKIEQTKGERTNGRSAQ